MAPKYWALFAFSLGTASASSLNPFPEAAASKDKPLHGEKIQKDIRSHITRRYEQDKVLRTAATSNKIVNGEEADAFQTPWMVSLQDDTGFHFCGGSLIQPDVVLTAAHCVPGGVHKVVIGAHDIVNGDDSGDDYSGSEEILVSEVYYHSGYDDDTFVNDIAILKLASASTHQTVNYYSDDAQFGTELDAELTTLTVSGWGTLTSGGVSPDLLQKVDVLAWSNEDCLQDYPDGITDDMLCAGNHPCNTECGIGYHTTSGCDSWVSISDVCVDSCQGDSGGPLFATTDTGYVVVGVVSWGSGCATSYPGVYSRVSANRDFIENYETVGTKLCTVGTNDCSMGYVHAIDSYGDRWNGAEISIKTCDGTELLSPTTLECSLEDFFCIDTDFTGKDIVVTVTDDSYPSEVMWTVYDPAGNEVHSGGACEETSTSEECILSQEFECSSSSYSYSYSMIYCYSDCDLSTGTSNLCISETQLDSCLYDCGSCTQAYALDNFCGSFSYSYTCPEGDTDVGAGWCYHETSTVKARVSNESAETITKPLSELKVGDFITKEHGFTEVMALPHSKMTQKSFEITMALIQHQRTSPYKNSLTANRDDTKIIATANHKFLRCDASSREMHTMEGIVKHMASSSNGKERLIDAQHLKRGDCLRTEHGPALVHSVRLLSEVEAEGNAYSVVTAGGTEDIIAVGGVYSHASDKNMLGNNAVEKTYLRKSNV